MKQLIAAIVLVTFAFTSAIPTAAQRRRAKPEPVKADRTEFERVEAVADGFGASVRWQMRRETDNALFLVYRVGQAGLELVSDTPLLGSAANAGRSTVFGTSYEAFDPKGSVGSVYIVETVAMDGVRSFSSATTALPKLDTTLGSKSISTRGRSPFTQKPELEKAAPDLPAELAAEVAEFEQAADLATHRWVVAQPGAKIGVRKEGLYRVTRAQLEAVGFNVSSNSANWRLFASGVEQSIIVGPGDQYIEFYGRGIDTPESDMSQYYLLADTTAGKRMATKVLRRIGANVAAQNYQNIAEKKERSSYVNSILNGAAENYWGPAILSSPSTTINFTLTGIDASAGTATVGLKIQGWSATVHAVTATLNGNQLSVANGNGPFPFTLTQTVPVSYLVEGQNTLVLRTGAANQFSLFDSFTVTYARKFRADQGRVSFYTPVYKSASVGNFSTANIRVFDIKYDGDPALVTDLPVTQNGATFDVRLPSYRPSVYYAVESGSELQPASVTRNEPSTLSTPQNAAGLLIISHSAPDFLTAAENWANYRRSTAGGSMTVKVVDIADVFDEFSFGEHSAASLSNFLNYAVNNWQTPPQYVLLIGDASYDPRNYQNLGYFDLIPTRMVNLVFAESGSDEALADFNGDGLAEIPIGRIPVRTAAHITTSLNKTMLFETAPLQSLDRGFVFASDLPEGYDFQAMSEELRAELPPTLPTTMVYRGQANAQSALINALNTGPFVANYSGHGSAGLWAHATFFGIDSVPALTNSNSPSIYTMLTCLNGYFLRPEFDSLAEVLVKAPSGGAVAAWASTEKTTPDIQMLMARRFYNKLGEGGIARLGDLVKDAKAMVPGASDVRLSWVLFGDPALKVR
jgi:hypothetical protein